MNGVDQTVWIWAVWWGIIDEFGLPAKIVQPGFHFAMSNSDLGSMLKHRAISEGMSFIPTNSTWFIFK